MAENKKRERAIPDNVPSGSVEPIPISSEFIAALRQAGLRDSVVSAVEKRMMRRRRPA